MSTFKGFVAPFTQGRQVDGQPAWSPVLPQSSESITTSEHTVLSDARRAETKYLQDNVDYYWDLVGRGYMGTATVRFYIHRMSQQRVAVVTRINHNFNDGAGVPVVWRGKDNFYLPGEQDVPFVTPVPDPATIPSLRLY